MSRVYSTLILVSVLNIGISASLIKIRIADQSYFRGRRANQKGPMPGCKMIILVWEPFSLSDSAAVSGGTVTAHCLQRSSHISFIRY